LGGKRVVSVGRPQLPIVFQDGVSAFLDKGVRTYWLPFLDRSIIGWSDFCRAALSML
jgi:hypothetical protein